MHYELNNFISVNAISCSDDIHFFGDTVIDAKSTYGVRCYNNEPSDKYRGNDKHRSNDNHRSIDKYINNRKNDRDIDKHRDIDKYINNKDHDDKKMINNYETKCIYKINMNNYYKNINIYNYKKKIFV